MTTTTQTITATISTSTNPAVAGRYFLDVRDSLDTQVTFTRDLDDMRGVLDRLQAAADAIDYTLVVIDTTGEVVPCSMDYSDHSGPVTIAADPYNLELEGDETEVAMCERHRTSRADDI